MKKKEKTVLSRPISYWISVLDRIKEGDIIPSSEMKRGMAALSIGMGYEDSYSSRNQAKLVTELLKMIPESCYEIVNETPKGKEKKAYIITFNSLATAKEAVKKFFTIPALTDAKATEKKEERVKEEPKKIEKAKLPQTKPEQTKKGDENNAPLTHLDRKSVNQIKTVWNILEHLYESKQNSETVSVLAKKCFWPGLKVTTSTIMDNITFVNELLSVNVMARPQKRTPTQVEILVQNVKDSLMKVGSEAQKLGVRLPLDKYIGSSKEKPNTFTSPELTLKEKKSAWIMAGILKENNGFYDRAKLLEVVNQNFKIDLTEVGLKNILRQPEFSTSATTNQIGLRNWNGARDKYSPEHSIRIVHARISMTLEELQRYFPDSEVVSEITSSDNIFKIVYDESRKSAYMMTMLVKSFRGTDCIIDRKAEIERLIRDTFEGINNLLLSEDHQLRFETF